MSDDPRTEVLTFPTPPGVAEAIASQWLEMACMADRSGKMLSIALSGGTAPRLLFTRLSQPDLCDSIPWNRIHLFWVDERCVPLAHPDSNFRMAHELLLDHTPIPQNNIHRIRGEADPASEAVRYTREITTYLPAGETGLPRFDWVLLGVGNDGHTASIFPGVDPIGSPVCGVTQRPENGQQRISLSLDVLNQAALVSFIVTGKEKSAVVSEILNATPESTKYPAARVRPINGRVQWFLDQEAAPLPFSRKATS